MSFYDEKVYKCELCNETSRMAFVHGICRSCTQKELARQINSICETCSSQCKQSALVSIAWCPDYVHKASPDKQKRTVGPLSAKSGVATPKTPKKALKRVKRKK